MLHYGIQYRSHCPPSRFVQAPPQRDRESRRRSRSKSSKLKADLRTVLLAKKTSTKKPWCLWLRASEGRPLWETVVYTSSYGAHLSLVPSGDRSVNPAIPSASGHSGLQRAHLSASARKHSGSGRLATSMEVSRAAAPITPEVKSRETDSLSRQSGSVEASAKCLTMGPADCRKRLQNTFRFSSASLQRGRSPSSGAPAGSRNGTRSRHSLEEWGHRGGPSSQQRVRFYSRYLIVPK